MAIKTSTTDQKPTHAHTRCIITRNTLTKKNIYIRTTISHTHTYRHTTHMSSNHHIHYSLVATMKRQPHIVHKNKHCADCLPRARQTKTEQQKTESPPAQWGPWKSETALVSGETGARNKTKKKIARCLYRIFKDKLIILKNKQNYIFLVSIVYYYYYYYVLPFVFFFSMRHHVSKQQKHIASSCLVF